MTSSATSDPKPESLDEEELDEIAGGAGSASETAPDGTPWAPSHTGHGSPHQGE